MKTLKRLNRLLNKIFVIIILALFYYIGVGLTAGFFRLFLLFKRQNKQTFWKKVPAAKNLDDFSSAY
jgi:hypothetical protein